MKKLVLLTGAICFGAIAAQAIQADQPAPDKEQVRKEAKEAMDAKKFGAMDKDGSGGVSLAEYKANAAERDEMRKQKQGEKFVPTKMENVEANFKKLDKDGDGQLSKEELFAPREPRVKKEGKEIKADRKNRNEKKVDVPATMQP